MITAAEIMAGVRGVFAVGVGREDWQEAFDKGDEPIARSFWAIPLTIPFIAMAVEGGRRIRLESYDTRPELNLPVPAYIISHTLASLLAWGAALAILYTLARKREIGARLGPLIIVQNWSSALTYFALAICLGVGVAGGLALAGAGMVAVMGLGLWIDWGMFRRPLGFAAGGALVTLILFQVFFIGFNAVTMALLLAILPGAAG